MNRSIRRCLAVALSASFAVACGGSKPKPEVAEVPSDERVARPSGGGPMVEQELGSIDQRAVERKFEELQSKLETCHVQGRNRVEYLAGDVKVFLRVGKDGRVRYSFFEESTIGDRETEKCILDLFGAASWPKPQGGEAEVRNGFGWSAGGEREPIVWGPEKVLHALEEDPDAKKSVESCKSGVSGDFHVTAYVEPGEANEHGSGKGASKGGGKKAGSKGKGKGESGGRFKALGVAVPNKEGAEKIDCVVDALRNLPLPSPGSYAAKVTFAL